MRHIAIRAAVVLGVYLLSGCGGEDEEEDLGPPVPTAQQLADTATKIDDIKGISVGPIGTQMWQFGNLGPKRGTGFFSDGSQAAIYIKPGAKGTTLNKVLFKDVVLYFSDAQRLRVLEMIRRNSTLEECETARGGIEKEIGMGMPDGPNRFTWTGKEYRGELQWKPNSVGGPWCHVLFQAANDVQIVR